MRAFGYGTPSRGRHQRRAFARVMGIAIGVFCCLAIATLTLQPVVSIALPNSPTATQPSALRLTSIPPTLAITASAMTNTVPALSKTAIVPTSGARVPDELRTPPAAQAPGATVQHFLVSRPVTSNVAMPYPDPVYLYGTTERGQFEVHHGEDFENPIGTPLYAVADGIVVTAGSDIQPICGSYGHAICGPALESEGYYGEVVVIQLGETYQGQPVFALYGHMNRITVSAGERVKQGDLIGEVGMTGVAIGPHVHFEVRLGANDYAHTRNPVLWMTPLSGYGSLAGRYTDAQGRPVLGAFVDIYRPDNTLSHETETYGRDRWPAVNSDDDLGEDFSVGDLPAGDYIVRVYGQSLEQHVTIQDGQLSFIEIGGQ